MKISIVTLSFNQCGYLREALESILQQEYPDVDYIVVDPGSTDGSRELIKSYAKSLSHIVFEPDAGAADGLNKGFAMACGEVFGFLNADDILYPGSLQRVADFFCSNPDCDVAFGNGFKIDGKGQAIRHFRGGNFTVGGYLYGGGAWLQQSTFFRADAFRRSPGFNIQNRTCWDGELFVTLVNQGAKVGYIDSDLGAFRIHQESISGSGRLNEQYLKDCRRIFRQVQGRDWNRADTFRQFAYRAAGYLIRTASRWKN